MKQSDPILAGIAREHLLIPTLETHRSDSLDFHDVAVWQVEAALKAAFEAGARSASKNDKAHALSSEERIPAALPTPPVVPGGTPLVPGKLYLRLYHGRTDPARQMDNWGFVGPTFGPLSCYIHTYCCNFGIRAECGASEVWLNVHDDMIQWDGCFYGDLAVFVAGAHEKA